MEGSEPLFIHLFSSFSFVLTLGRVNKAADKHAEAPPPLRMIHLVTSEQIMELHTGQPLIRSNCCDIISVTGPFWKLSLSFWLGEKLHCVSQWMDLLALLFHPWKT